MIKIENPLLGLFQMACQMKSSHVKSKFEGFGILVKVIKGEYTLSCSRCFRYLSDPKRLKGHENICGTKKRFDAVSNVLTLKIDKTLHCQMGCSFKTTCMKQIAKHFYENHSYEELEMWGINRNLLTEIS